MKFKTLAGVEYQMDLEDALHFVGVAITMRSNGYLGIQSHDWPGDAYVHREILKAGPKDIVDHINGVKLDLRRSNLRVCSQQQNSYNARLRKNNITGVRGVYWDNKRMKWSVQITANKKTHSLGRYDDFEVACNVRFDAERRLHGDHAAIDCVLAGVIG